jgi:hypothetical protein
MGGRGSKIVARNTTVCGRATVAEVRAMGRKMKGNRVNPASGRPIYRWSTESARCGSFRCTTRLNGSIREVREKIKVDFLLIDYSYDLNPCLGR